MIEETLGPLSKYYRIPYSIHLLVDSSIVGEKYIKTSPIQGDFNELYQAFNRLGADEREAYKQRVTVSVNLVYGVLRKQLDQTRRFAFKPSAASHPGARQSLVTLSIVCLCTYLCSLFDLYDATRYTRFEYLEQGILEGRLQDQMEALVLDRYDERTSAYGLLVVAERPASGILKVIPSMDIFVVSATSGLPEEEELLFLKEMAKDLDSWTRPVGMGEEVVWRDPFSKEGLVEWTNKHGAAWWELDDQNKQKGDRWNYSYDDTHYVFQSLSLSSDQAWCVT